VEDKTTQERLSVKVVSKERVVKFKLQEYLVNEKQIMEELDHPFIMKQVSTFKDHRRVYFLSELVKGMDMYSQLQHLRNLFSFTGA